MQKIFINNKIRKKVFDKIAGVLAQAFGLELSKPRLDSLQIKSNMARLRGVKRLRVRGLNAVRFCVVLKACAVNIFRATAPRNAHNAAETPPQGPTFGIFRLVYVFKERLLSFGNFLRKLSLKFSLGYEISSQMTA